MRTKIIANPFFCYIFSFGLSLLIYSWGWSELYPALTVEIVIFLLTSFLIAIIAGRRVGNRIKFKTIGIDEANWKIIVFILLGYILEFIYNGGIPVYLLFKGNDIAYMDFGIPTFHVLLHTFTSFYTVYIYHQYISNRNNKLLILLFLLLIPNILIVNRGALIMTLTACLIIYLLSIGRVVVKRLLILFIGACIFFYGFGFLGNARSFNGDSTALLKVTKVSDDFTDGFIPNEYYWFYIYASSPFANFQNATITSVKHKYDVLTFVTWELLPDFISKRIVPIDEDLEGKNRLDYSIHPTLTVGSIYFEPFIRMGWYGPIIVFLFYTAIVFSYIKLFPTDSKYFITSVAILCVISIFNIFENMINFSGLSVQLIFPILLSRLEKVKVTFSNLKTINLVFLRKKIKFLAH
ncbi:hypothetical protein [Spirosoma oryzicola]|uniref:hypothetical protein n=1 Tax=Spirosoma oryzicola TaxID=2898794 RepID=UPI001E5E9F09|nr:hypothetical protein [Spirosoma oryzicola]UHG91716.1 hypothetical protein LQ777_02180 [Spirosoma oryzicola]